MNTMTTISDATADFPGEYAGTCRVCMTTSSLNLRNIFEETKINIIEKIEFCTGLLFQEEYGYPSQICGLCVRNLSMAYKFKSKCLQSDETFRQLRMVKLEKMNYGEAANDNMECSNNEDDLDKRGISNALGDDIKNEVLEEDLLFIEITTDDDKQFNVCKTSDECVDPAEEELSSSKKPIKVVFKPPKRRGRPKVSKSPFCDTCDMELKNKYEFEKHRREIHQDAETWQCEICGKHFVHRPSLYVHIRSHMPPEYACDSCEYRTCYKYDLIKHKRIHSGDKQFKCEHCAQAFHNASNLRKHMIRQHDGGDPKFPCPRENCKKAFHDRTELNFHLDSHDDVKRFKCDVCHTELSRRNHWKKHMMRQHKIMVPPAKAGRRRSNFLLRDSDGDEKSSSKSKQNKTNASEDQM